MLPEFPATKKKIKSVVTERLRRTVYRETALLSRMHKFQSHEGDSFTICRLDGTVETNRYREMAVELTIEKKDLATLTPKALAERIDKAALEMAGKMSKTTFEKLREITAKSGQVHDAKGKQFSPDIFCEALEMIDIEFDEKGDPSGMTFVVGPELGELIKQKGPEWEADPEFKRRHSDLMQRKREAWRDRESRRKLVD